MEQDPSSFDWAHNAFIALNDNHLGPASEKWSIFTPHSQMSSAFTTMSPVLQTQASVERHGQLTPPEDLSPTEARRDSAVRECSIPVEQLMNEVPWPVEHHQIEALRNYQPQQELQDSPDRAPKRRRTTKAPAIQSPANQNLGSQTQAAPNSSEQQATGANPQPAKRKRGRPKSQPQTIEAYTQDGIPFTVSSARQSHLEKNRVAAHKCRQRRKEYIDNLEARGRDYSAKNKALKENVALLREELLELKNEVLRHAGCNFWPVDKYLARCAGDLMRVDPLRAVPLRADPPRHDQMEDMDVKEYRETSASTGLSYGSPGFDDYFLKDFDEQMERPAA